MEKSKKEELLDVLKNTKITYEDIIANYEQFLYVFESLLKDMYFSILDVSKGQEITSILIDEIYKKLDNKEILSVVEGSFFLRVFYYEALKHLEIDASKIVDMDFVYSDDDRLKGKKTACHSTSVDGVERIYYRYDETLEIFIQNEFSSLAKLHAIGHCIAHEVGHSSQTQHSLRGVIDFTSYVSTLEKVIRTVGTNYYAENYYNTMLEVDANIKANECVLSFIKKYKLLKNADLIDYEKECEEYRSIQMDAFLSHKEKNTNMPIGRFLLDNATEVLKENPELIKKYKLLGLSHSSDGELRSLESLEYYKNNFSITYTSRCSEISKIYDFIYKSYDAFEFEK